VASASYEARKFGVKPRMFVFLFKADFDLTVNDLILLYRFIRDAKKLCPEAIVVACQYKRYEEVSKIVYNIFFKHSNKVQPVSGLKLLLRNVTFWFVYSMFFS